MENLVINRSEYKNYFDYISKFIKDQQIELEVMGLDIGNQIESDWIPLEGITFHEKEDSLVIYTALLDHTIKSPIEIIVAEQGTAVKVLFIKDKEGHSHILQFRPPVMLEGPKPKFQKKHAEDHPSQR